MQYTLFATLSALVGVALAGPMSLHLVRACDTAGCFSALEPLLGPAALTCGSSIAEIGANPIADISCLTTILGDVSDPPAQCAGCGAAAISGAQSIGTKIAGAASSALSDIENLF